MVMMDMQKLIDTLGNQHRETRSRYHLTLSGLIDGLELIDAGKTVMFDTESFPGSFLSYRGYYADLALDWSDTPISAGELRAKAEEALGQTFKGYKGGDFYMREDTPLWMATYGTTAGSRAIVGIEDGEGALILLTKDVD